MTKSTRYCVALAALLVSGCSGASEDGGGSGGAGGEGATTSSTASTSSSATSSSSSTGSGGGSACLSVEVLSQEEIGAAPYGIAVDDSHVYWGNSGTGQIRRATKDGSMSETLAEGQGSPWGVRLFNGELYWVSHSVDGVLSKVAIDGGTPVPLATAPAARDLVINGSTVFWTREPDDVERVGLDGSEPALLISANMLSNTIALDDTYIYWVNLGDGQVKRALFDGTEESPLATGQAQPWGIALDDTHVYWTNSADGSIARVAKTGGGVEIIATGQVAPMGIALDETHVYWVDNETGIVAKAPKTGGEPIILADCQHRPLKLVLDETHAYWTGSTDDTVVRVLK